VALDDGRAGRFGNDSHDEHRLVGAGQNDNLLWYARATRASSDAKVHGLAVSFVSSSVNQVSLAGAATIAIATW
jgi:hypothetical protein